MFPQNHTSRLTIFWKFWLLPGYNCKFQRVREFVLCHNTKYDVERSEPWQLLCIIGIMLITVMDYITYSVLWRAEVMTLFYRCVGNWMWTAGTVESSCGILRVEGFWSFVHDRFCMLGSFCDWFVLELASRICMRIAVGFDLNIVFNFTYNVAVKLKWALIKSHV